MSRVAGVTSNTVPWEILRAAGFAPRLLEFETGPTPFADHYMEDVFDRRIRVIFDRLCAGSWKDLDLVVIPRTSEQEHKLFLYLVEAARTRVSDSIPELYFYDLLHTRNSDSYAYGLERTREMLEHFEVSSDALCAAIHESNDARRAVQAIQERRVSGALEGSSAREWIRGFYVEDRAKYAEQVLSRIAGLSHNVRLNRPRILIQGALLDSADVHGFVEQAGGYVVAEDDWRGSRAGGTRDVNLHGDPSIEIFEKYFYDESSPRIPSGERDGWFQRIVNSGMIDGVVFYIPFEDDVAGWDYPRQATWLEQQQVPGLLLRDTSDQGPMNEFVRRIVRG